MVMETRTDLCLTHHTCSETACADTPKNDSSRLQSSPAKHVQQHSRPVFGTDHRVDVTKAHSPQQNDILWASLRSYSLLPLLPCLPLHVRRCSPQYKLRLRWFCVFHHLI